ncbi:coiled-coil domain-containing protein 177-like [Hyla sarda]|uniref:coiled-coil domain-containing protein 177-like n=1 Tax=Hyla sarda TaxID=327740 RepID=UPI0024C3DFF3|nr:coiled-coil domain-containing protein 177-like [Hyla sarda]
MDGRRSPSLHLDLTNFEDGGISRYVLTSPRSLEACELLGVRPVDLLFKSYGEVRGENPGASSQEVSEMYEAHELERLKKLRLCRELRKNLLDSDGDLGGPDSSRTTPTSQDRRNHRNTIISHTQNPCNHRKNITSPTQNPCNHRKNITSPTQNPCNHRKNITSPDHWDYLDVTTSRSYQDLSNTKASPAKGHRGEGEMLRSLSQGNLQPEVQVRHLTRMVEKEIKVSVPERDKKIAALMLLRHQNEEISKQRKLQAQQAWEDLRSKERLIREALSKHDWTDRWQNRRKSPRSSKLEWQLDAVRYLNAQECKTLTAEERILLKDGMKKVQRDLQSKRRTQEKDYGEMGDRLLEERMLQAFKSKMIKDLQDKKNIQFKNKYEKLRHSRLKEEVDSQVKAEERSMRRSIEQKERRFREMYEQIQEERQKEIQEKVSREEGMIAMAKIRAEQREKEQIRQKKMLVQATNQKILQAKDSSGKSIQNKAERTRDLNVVKEKVHQLLKQKVEEDEENQRKQLAHVIKMKDRKSDKVLKEKEATVEEGKKIARASFHIREKIRERTRSRTFDQMALEAQLSASFLRSIP